MVVCKYYLLGTCNYGSKCKYEHIRDGNKNKFDNNQQTSYVNNRGNQGYNQNYNQNYNQSYNQSYNQNYNRNTQNYNNQNYNRNNQSYNQNYNRNNQGYNQSYSQGYNRNNQSFNQNYQSQNYSKTYNQQANKNRNQYSSDRWNQDSRSSFGNLNSSHDSPSQFSFSKKFQELQQIKKTGSTSPNFSFTGAYNALTSRSAKLDIAVLDDIITSTPRPPGANTFAGQVYKETDSIYSKKEDLTEEELKAYEADEFEEGNLPMNPPSKDLCF